MYRLFWKIFLSFWIALILFSGATILTASLFLERMRTQSDIAHPRERLLNYAAQAQAVAGRQGLDGLRHWALRVDRQELVPLLLVDDTGHDILGRPVPEWVTSRLLHQTRHPATQTRARIPLVHLTDGTQYRAVFDFQSVTLGRVLRRPRVITLPLIVAALVSGIVCFALARYLTAPIEKLRHATEAYAAGNLNERVAPALGPRRDEVADLARSFDRMAQRLQALISTQRQLLSDVSHELRSPLARVQVALGLARQRIGDDAVPELDRIERETERLSELIGQLLSLARLEAGVVPGEREVVDLGDIVATVATDADFEARAANRRVVIEKNESVMVSGDAGLLHSAFENIVRNAVRYTREGTAVMLAVERDLRQPQEVRVVVRDQGPGVPADFLPRVFEPFVRVDNARDRASGGYGLGLAIAQKAIRLHGGMVAAENASVGGLAVTVTLPVAS